MHLPSPLPAFTYTLTDIPVTLHLGVPATERATPQTIFVTVQFSSPQHSPTDDITAVTDYQTVYDVIISLADLPPTHLVESLLTTLHQRLTSQHITPQRLTITKRPFPQGSVTVQWPPVDSPPPAA